MYKRPFTIQNPTPHITIVTCVTFAILSTCSFSLGSPCHNDSWWDYLQSECIKCTNCENNQIVLRPCQLHQDTVCGTFHDINIDWRSLARTEPNWKERRKALEELNLGQNPPESETRETKLIWDWQAVVCLMIAIMACLFFFLAAALILLQHMKQWRQMERRLDRDVEELSTKLMNKLAKVQNIENGTFLIDSPINRTLPVEIQCVYLEQLLAGKESFNRGNFYIEETGSKG